MNKFSVPGGLASDLDPAASKDPAWLQAVNEGFLGAGIPLRKFTEGQQDFGFREAEDRFIQDPFKEYNQSGTGFRIYQSNRNNGNSFRVENVATGQVVFESANPTEALSFAKRMG